MEDIPANRVRQNVISSISPEGEMFYWLFPGHMNAETFIDYLERLIEWCPQKVFLFADNHPAHTAKKVQSWLKAHEGQIEILWLPRYSPEYNPDELLNNDLKQSLETHPLPETSEGFREIVRHILEKIANMPSRIKSYFDHSELELGQA